tara:strand:+ start:1118 stop:1225 length:108 start_codon:yes stop_codon:yes gene_type:complete
MLLDPNEDVKIEATMVVVVLLVLAAFGVINNAYGA